MSQNHVAVVRRIYKAWATGDFFGVNPSDFDEHAMHVVRRTSQGRKIVRVEAILREANALEAVGAYGSTTASPENGPS